VIYHLLSIFFQKKNYLFSELGVQKKQSALSRTFDKLTKSVVNNLETRIPGDVAANELTVHTHGFTGYLETGQLVSGELFEALFHQVDAMSVFVFANASSQ
jgi:hypothetical protein